MVRPLRRPARVLVFVSMLVVVTAGLYVYAGTPPQSYGESNTVRFRPDSSAVFDIEPRGDLAAAGLRSGDRVVRWGGLPVTPSRADSLAKAAYLFEGGVGETFALRVERGGEVQDVEVVIGQQDALDARRFGFSDAAVMRWMRGLVAVSVLAFVVVGLTLFVRSRARGYQSSLAVALLAVAGGSQAMVLMRAEGAGHPVLIVLTVLAFILFISALPAVTAALVRFPDGLYVPRWTRWVRTASALGVVAFFGLSVIASEAHETAWLEIGGNVLLMGLLILPTLGLIQKYRGAEGGVVRQQMKWVVLPLGAFVAVFAVGAVASELIPAFDSDVSASGYLFDCIAGALVVLTYAAIPLGVLAGALHFRPWDADLWIARSAAVGAATLVLTGVFAGGVEAMRVGLQASFGAGAEPVAGALAAVVSLAAFNPVREWFLRRADADLLRTREALCDRLPLVLTGRQVVAPPAEVGRVALGVVRDALRTERAAVLTDDEGGAWSAVACEGVEGEAACAWAARTLPHPDALPAHSEQVWEDSLFVLRVPLRSVEGEPVGVLALGTHGRGRGYSTEERRALDGASFALAEALLVSERRETSRARDYDRLAGLVARFGDATGDGHAGEPVRPETTPPRP